MLSEQRLRLGCMIVAVALALAVAVTPERAHASAPALFGYGARASAMAGTVTATASGHEAVYYNPAGLAFARRPSFSLGYQLASFFLSVDGRDVDTDSAPALVIGFDVPLPFRGALANTVTIGFGFVLPQNAILIADIPQPGTPRFVRLASRAQTVSVMAGLGLRLFDELAIGAGFIALSELRGAIDVAPNDARRIGASVQDALVADYAGIFGAVYRPTPWLSFGAVYRDESTADFSLPITADLGDQFPLPIPRLDIAGTAQYDPRQLTLAGSLAVSRELLLAAALVYEAWSRFRNPIVFTAVPDNFPEQPSPGFSDILIFRAGGEARIELGDWLLMPRAGAAFEPTPVPEQRGFHNYLDNPRLILSGGGGVRWMGLRLDLSAQWHLLLERTDTKDPALVAEVPPLIPGERPTTGPKISHAGAVFAASLELGIEL